MAYVSEMWIYLPLCGICADGNPEGLTIKGTTLSGFDVVVVVVDVILD